MNMKIIIHPAFEQANTMLQRPQVADEASLRNQVRALLDDLRQGGDQALLQLAERFDGPQLKPFKVEPAIMASAAEKVPESLRLAIQQAYANIRSFHAAQSEPESAVETMPGVRCWRRAVPIERVGLYIPGGSAPLFSTVLMLGVPAQIAGCRDVVLCTPAGPDGDPHPAVLYAAMLCGIEQAYRLGGVQAIGAMAYGLADIAPVYKIFGPGNAWVTAAKQLVALDGVAIDMPAGPSEVAVVADDTANPAFVAADLISQAEHGVDSQVILFSNSAALVERVQDELGLQLEKLPRRDIARQALAHSKAIVLSSLDEAMQWSNAYAPEHLILQVEDPGYRALQVVNAGSVFLGPYTPESAGDYASGTNHTLPTGGWAKAYAGVSLDAFVKKITFQEITPGGLQLLGPTIETMAAAEGLYGHAQAVRIRNAEFGMRNAEYGVRNVEWARKNIVDLKPYQSARDEFQMPNSALRIPHSVFLDANENSLGGALRGRYARYPDPHQRQLKEKIAALKAVQPENLFLGNGSDEAIDLLLRVFVEPGADNVVITPPTYGMYKVQANIHGAVLREAPLQPDFSLDAALVLQQSDHRSKVLFLCSPNNPTGNSLEVATVEQLLRHFPGLVVVDEAYIDFSGRTSWVNRLDEFPNLVVLQTFSKAWGLAGLRLGVAMASAGIIQLLEKVKYPYNINQCTLQMAEKALSERDLVEAQIRTLVYERHRLSEALTACARVRTVFPSDANFLLVRFDDAGRIYGHLASNGIVVRNRSLEKHCEQCLRITVGTPEQNDALLALVGDG
jgi:histidinol dehydrogenase